MRILITGASGLIGSALVPRLVADGHSVGRLVRGSPSAPSELHWHPGEPLYPALLQQTDAVIHLAGKNIGVRWNDIVKRELVSSRVEGTRTIAHAVAESFRANAKPTVLISASAIGYYGSRGDEEMTEDSAPGSGFLGELTRAWEDATNEARDAGVRTAMPRFGVVLSGSGGALPRMLTPFRLGIGGPIGSGRQWMSWVSLEDGIGAIEHILRTNELRGPVNVVAPEPVTNAEFTKSLARALHRPAFMRVPATAIRLAFGEMGEEVVLSSTRAKPAKLLATGYEFRHPTLAEALTHLVGDQ